MDKRRNKKGKWEYLIRWKGYGSKEDTWEPENHLLHCEEFIEQFNSLRLHTHKRPKVSKSRGESLLTNHKPATEHAKARSETRKKRRTGGPAVGVGLGTVLGTGSGASGATQKHRKIGVGPGKHLLGDRMRKSMTYKAPVSMGAHFVPPVRVPHNGLQNGDMDPLKHRATRSHRLPTDKVDGEQGDADNTGQQYTPELGRIYLYLQSDKHLKKYIGSWVVGHLNFIKCKC